MQCIAQQTALPWAGNAVMGFLPTILQTLHTTYKLAVHSMSDLARKKTVLPTSRNEDPLALDRELAACKQGQYGRRCA